MSARYFRVILMNTRKKSRHGGADIIQTDFDVILFHKKTEKAEKPSPKNCGYSQGAVSSDGAASQEPMLMFTPLTVTPSSARMRM